MSDVTTPDPRSPDPGLPPLARLRALRAIMDGRGVRAVVVSDPGTLAWFGVPAQMILLTLAAEAAVLPATPAGWAEAARRIGTDTPVGVGPAARLPSRLAVVPLDRDLARLRAGQVTGGK